MQDIEVTPTGDIRIAVKVSEFKQDATCPKCGNKPFTWLENLVRQIRGEARMSTVGLRFCEGSKPLTEDVRVLFGTAEMKHACAGVEHDHLHASCGFCSYSWLMKCQDRA